MITAQQQRPIVSLDDDLESQLKWRTIPQPVRELTPSEAALPWPVKRAIRLCHLTELIESEREWFEEVRPNPFSGGELQMKTMYDVSAELVIPRTTCDEKVVRLGRLHLERLLPALGNDQGGLVLKRDVEVGGMLLEAGLTLGGQLCAGGQVRRRYWSMGAARSDVWMTTVKDHGRATEQLAELPSDLVAGGEPLGEAQESLELHELMQLREGDTVVFRRGVSYSELFGPTVLQTFVSHWWGEETLKFHTSLQLYAQQPGRSGERHAFWICTFANCQHHVTLGDTWRTSPFNVALESGARTEVVMVLDDKATPLQRIWCVFEMFRCTVLQRKLELYCDEGRVDATSSTAAGKALRQRIAQVDLESATASCEADRLMILHAIEQESSMTKVTLGLKRHLLDFTNCMGALQVAYDPITNARIDLEHVKGVVIKPMKKKLLANMCKRRCTPSPSFESAHDFYREVVTMASRRVVIAAGAGAGKSLLAKQLALQACRHNSVKGVPVRVELAQLVACIRSQVCWRPSSGSEVGARRSSAGAEDAEDADSISNESQVGRRQSVEARSGPREDLLQIWAQEHFGDFADELLQVSTPLVLVLDGLDECGSYALETLRWLKYFLKSRWHTPPTVIMTSRPDGLAPRCMRKLKKLNFRFFQLERLQEQSATAILSQMGASEAMVRQTLSQVPEMWDRPLMLLLLYNYLQDLGKAAEDFGESPPKITQVAVLDAVFKRIVHQAAALAHLEADEVRTALLKLAHHQHTQGLGSRYVNDEALATILPPDLAKLALADKLLVLGEHGGRVMFVHLVLQQFMAALRILEDEDSLVKKLQLDEEELTGRLPVHDFIMQIVEVQPKDSPLLAGGRRGAELLKIAAHLGRPRAAQALISSAGARREPIPDWGMILMRGCALQAGSPLALWLMVAKAPRLSIKKFVIIAVGAFFTLFVWAFSSCVLLAGLARWLRKAEEVYEGEMDRNELTLGSGEQRLFFAALLISFLMLTLLNIRMRFIMSQPTRLMKQAQINTELATQHLWSISESHGPRSFSAISLMSTTTGGARDKRILFGKFVIACLVFLFVAVYFLSNISNISGSQRHRFELLVLLVTLVSILTLIAIRVRALQSGAYESMRHKLTVPCGFGLGCCLSVEEELNIFGFMASTNLVDLLWLAWNLPMLFFFPIIYAVARLFSRAEDERA